MKLVLLGYMGCGKSTVGKLLAAQLGFSFKDLDAEIESETKKSISELFSEKGEIYFRKKENTVLKHLLDTDQHLVIALGGGTPCYSDIMSNLNSREDIITVYLKTRLDMLIPRLFSEKLQRPLIAHIETEEKLEDFIRKHLFERSYYYNQAKIIVDTDTFSASEISKKIVVQLF